MTDYKELPTGPAALARKCLEAASEPMTPDTMGPVEAQLRWQFIKPNRVRQAITNLGGPAWQVLYDAAMRLEICIFNSDGEYYFGDIQSEAVEAAAELGL